MKWKICFAKAFIKSLSNRLSHIFISLGKMEDAIQGGILKAAKMYMCRDLANRQDVAGSALELGSLKVKYSRIFFPKKNHDFHLGVFIIL